MCGIAGFITTSDIGSEEATRVALDMSSTLRHRGPDDSGAWVDPQAGIALAQTRLAVIDLSPDGRQPMLSRSGRHVLIYNGELYNYRTLRVELEAAGITFRGASDTEVLLEAIDHYGVAAALRRLDGMFAFALWDKEERCLVLARDRLGEKPLFYGYAGNDLIFASECKALRRHPSFSGDVDVGALTLFLRHGYVPAPHSIYRGVKKLEPGAYVRVPAHRRNRDLNPQRYWSLANVVAEGRANLHRGSPKEVVDELEVMLRKSVRSRMVADVPLGAFLSGGIDSSTVVALMQAESRRPVRTFTIGFHEDTFDEAVHGGAVARHLATDHTELYVSPKEALEVIPELPHVYDEPFADSSQIPTLLVSALARRHVTVALSGDGGDELFGGYTRYLFSRALWSRLEHIPLPARRRLAAALKAVPPQRWDRLMRRLAPVVPRRVPTNMLGDKLHKAADVIELATAEAAYRSLISQWQHPESGVVGGREPRYTLTDRSLWPDAVDETSRMMFLDGVTYLPDDILVKLDRAAMAHSLETRVPLLAPDVVAFAWRLPMNMKIRGDEGKWALRRVLERYVPIELFDRPKMGFGVPLGEWLRGPLKGWASDLLEPRSLAEDGFLRPNVVGKMLQEHLTGARDWKYALWTVLMFQAWRESVR